MRGLVGFQYNLCAETAIVCQNNSSNDLHLEFVFGIIHHMCALATSVINCWPHNTLEHEKLKITYITTHFLLEGHI